MKTSILGLIALVAFALSAHAQIQLTLDVGILRNSTGAAVEPVGGLLQLIASPSGTFGTASSSSYVSGDNVLVASFAMNFGSGVNGETTNTLANLPLISLASSYSSTNGYTTGMYTLTTGEQVELRWYPSLQFSTSTNYTTSAPSLSTTYGMVRSSSVEFPSDASETAWIVPGAGNPVDLTYVTSDDGGLSSYAPATAYASSTVVPEPSTYGMLTCGLVALASWTLRRRA